VWPPTTIFDKDAVFTNHHMQNSSNVNGIDPVYYSRYVSLARWDVGSLTAGEVIQNASLIIWDIGGMLNDQNLNALAEWVVWDGTLKDGDYTNSPGSTAFSLPVSTFGAVAERTIPLTGFAGLEVGPGKYLSLRFGMDGGNPDVVGAGPNINNQVNFANSRHATHPGPILRLVTAAAPVVPPTSRCPLLATYNLCTVTFTLRKPNNVPWSYGVVTLQLSHPCHVRGTAFDANVQGAGELVTLVLDALGVGSVTLFPQAACCPLEAYPQSNVHYLIRMPDGNTHRCLVPDALTCDFVNLTFLD
jgi:hypothetical protein